MRNHSWYTYVRVVGRFFLFSECKQIAFIIIKERVFLSFWDFIVTVTFHFKPVHAFNAGHINAWSWPPPLHTLGRILNSHFHFSFIISDTTCALYYSLRNMNFSATNVKWNIYILDTLHLESNGNSSLRIEFLLVALHSAGNSEVPLLLYYSTHTCHIYCYF